MRYEWDERKNLENQRKHGVSFEVAARVLDDENRLIRMDRVDESGELRWHAIGSIPTRSGARAILIVVHVYRFEGGEGVPPESPEEGHYDEEIIRIISARAAGPDDFRRYQEQELD